MAHMAACRSESFRWSLSPFASSRRMRAQAPTSAASTSIRPRSCARAGPPPAPSTPSRATTTSCCPARRRARAPSWAAAGRGRRAAAPPAAASQPCCASHAVLQPPGCAGVTHGPAPRCAFPPGPTPTAPALAPWLVLCHVRNFEQNRTARQGAPGESTRCLPSHGGAWLGSGAVPVAVRGGRGAARAGPALPATHIPVLSLPPRVH